MNLVDHEDFILVIHIYRIISKLNFSMNKWNRSKNMQITSPIYVVLVPVLVNISSIMKNYKIKIIHQKIFTNICLMFILHQHWKKHQSLLFLIIVVVSINHCIHSSFSLSHTLAIDRFYVNIFNKKKTNSISWIFSRWEYLFSNETKQKREIFKYQQTAFAYLDWFVTVNFFLEYVCVCVCHIDCTRLSSI